METINTTLFMFDVFDLDIDKEVRVFVACGDLDTAFKLLETGFGEYDFIRVAKVGPVKVAAPPAAGPYEVES